MSMGLFREAGRRVERFRKAAEAAAAAEADYRCGACEERVFADEAPDRCPACDADALVVVDDGAEGTDGDTE